MIGQLTLDDAARSTDPATSHQAAAANPTGRITDRDRALDALRRAGPDGLTDHELADRIGRAQTSAGKRRGELVALGLVEATTLTRPSPWGAPCIVWRAV